MSTFGPEYSKIQTLFKRDEKNVIMPWNWTSEELEYLSESEWRFTEKIDGTNIRVHWNGDCITVGGRTDKAQVPTDLIANLGFLNHPPLWKTIFNDADDVTVYGEGYGAGIQKGGDYRPDKGLIVFDVKVGDWWLRPDDVKEICNSLGLDTVPHVLTTTLTAAVDAIHDKTVSSAWQNVIIEGLVGTPTVVLFDRRGNRIITKIKTKDFDDYAKRK